MAKKPKPIEHDASSPIPLGHSEAVKSVHNSSKQLKTPKTCNSCGTVHGSVKYSTDKDNHIWYNCRCGSTHFIPTDDGSPFKGE